jgi:hypothetical protein
MKSYSMEKMELAADASETLISKEFRDACEEAIDILVQRIEVLEKETDRKKLAKMIAAGAVIAVARKIFDEQDKSILSRANKKILKSRIFD